MPDAASPLAVINVVGLTASLIGKHTPHLNKLISAGDMQKVSGVFPALTTSAQASMVTGKPPSEHGIVGNGWYWRDLAEVKFWLQPDRLVQAPKVWQQLQQDNPEFVCSRLFWWYNMYSDVAYSVTPRPHYHADGRKEVGLYSAPEGLHQRLETELGAFPFSISGDRKPTSLPVSGSRMQPLWNSNGIDPTCNLFTSPISTITCNALALNILKSGGTWLQ